MMLGNKSAHQRDHDFLLKASVMLMIIEMS